MKEKQVESDELNRGLKNRHLFMISLGGTIGTGLFMGIASPLATVGPLGTIIAYLLAGCIMLATMLCLGELSCAFPHAGSFQHYALMFLPHPIWSYMIGWLYWLSWVLAMAADLTAAAIIAHKFFPGIPIYLFSFIILAVLTLINLRSVMVFGETEYWFAAIKVLTIIVFIIVGGWLIFYNYQTTLQPPSLATEQGLFPHGFFSIFMCMSVVTYSFQGIELIGSAAGEAKSPQIILPKIIMGVTLRIILFYVVAIAILAVVYPYNIVDSEISPFAWAFKAAGITNASLIMTLVIFCAAVSAANVGIYASSRMLWSMAKSNLAPKAFSKVNAKGAPVRGIIFISIIALTSLCSKFIAADKLYIYLIAGTGQVGCLAWIVIAWCQYRFRKAVNRGDYPPETIKFRSPWFPWLAYFSIIINIVVIVGLWFAESGLCILASEIILVCIIFLSYPIFRYYSSKH